MPRFSSLPSAAFETRRLLRNRLGRFLNHAVEPVATHEPKRRLSDESLLTLLLNLRIDFANDFSRASKDHAANRTVESSEPDLKQLLADGWIHSIWGRLCAPYRLAALVQERDAEELPALATLYKGIHQESYSFCGDFHGPPELVEIAHAIRTGTLLPRDVGSESPAWVAARLWDRTLRQGLDPILSLRVWIDRWKLLGSPALVPARVWSRDDAEAFRAAALAVLTPSNGLLGWEERRAAISTLSARYVGQLPAHVLHDFPDLPRTLIGRAQWLREPSIHRSFSDLFLQCDDLISLVWILLSDIASDDIARAPHPVATPLIHLATTFPDVLFLFLLHIRTKPILLADLLLTPATCPLACQLVADWTPSSGAWERSLVRNADHSTQSIAFEDALGVLTFLFEAGSLPAEEVTDLVVGIYDRTSRYPASSNYTVTLTVLREEFRLRPTELLKGVFAELCRRVDDPSRSDARLAAALDIATVLDPVGELDGSALVKAYIVSIVSDSPFASHCQFDTTQAATLVQLGLRTETSLYRQFLHPFGSAVSSASDASTPTEDQFTRERRLARSIRRHVRMLARAVAAAPAICSDQVLTALISAVRTGALRHAEKGRIPAFAAMYETWPYAETTRRPISADIAAALAALDSSEGDRLLTAVLEIDEPAVLARLVRTAPAVARGRIQQRLAGLTPGNSGEIHSLREAQLRIDSLLLAGMGETAEVFMRFEHELETFGVVPERQVDRLRMTLRLHVLREEWTEISATSVPVDISPHQREAAADTITFYQALAELGNSEGDKERAEALFCRLRRKRSDVPAYGLNLLAARICSLLGKELFPELRGTSLKRGRHLLVEADEVVRDVQDIDDEQRTSLSFNKGVLLLSVGDNQAAEDLFGALYGRNPSDSAAAYLAVARCRLGRTSDACTVLQEANETLGDSELLEHTRKYILGESSASSKDDGRVPKIRTAIAEFHMLEPHIQAQVLASDQNVDSVTAVVTSAIRSAAASMVELVPVRRDTKLRDSEDDHTTVLRELLIPRFELLSWTVQDQSLGGYSPIGNPGERDLLVKRGAATIAVIEAIVYESTTYKKNLGDHLKRLFGYSTCSLFCYLAYAYRPDLRASLENLEAVAEYDAPAGWQFQRNEQIERTDSRPPGFIAHYEGPAGPVRVVFCLVNMGQEAQRSAAAATRRHAK